MIVVQIRVERPARGEGDTPLLLYAAAGQANGTKRDPSEDVGAISAALRDAVARLSRAAALEGSTDE